MNFVVLSSSRGTTFQAVLNAVSDGNLTMKCCGLITDSPDKLCIEKAKAAGVAFKVVEKNKNEQREDFDKRVHQAILDLLKETGSPQSETVLAEMGWMWIHTPWFIGQWKNRIINVHPSLLPKYGGKGMYGDRVHKAVLENNEKETGISIHIMDEGVDTGTILVQKNCSINEGDTVEDVRNKAQSLEKEWYPKTLQMIETRELQLPSS